MTTDKYYTPSIEEFHHGFQYELFEDFDVLPTREWHKQTYGIHGANPETLDFVSIRTLQDNRVRVKYLDKEDIEECGWKEKITDYTGGFWNYTKNTLQYSYKSRWLCIIQNDHGNNICLFQGYIKNKSELQVLLKQVVL